jgi:2'-5' RNA ligase
MKPTDRLFLAVFPDPPIAQNIGDLVTHLQIFYELDSQPVADDRFHCTLQVMHESIGLDKNITAAVIGLASRAEMPSFRVEFNNVFSFKDGGLALGGDDGAAGMCLLQERIGKLMTAVGLGRIVRRRYKPHVTMLYGSRPIATHPIEPIGWQVKEFVLVHSLLGRTRYNFLARFPLR